MDIFIALFNGFKTTLLYFFVTLIASIPLGLFIALLEQKAPKTIKIIIHAYIYLFRGTPLLLQMMFVFFGLPYINIVLSRHTAATVTFVLNYAAYFVEIFRGGLNAIPKGQYEAIKVLSMSQVNGYKSVILPQLWRIVMPSVGNEVISLIKDTSLIYILGLEDLLKVGRSLSNQLASLVPFIYVAIFYLIFTGITTLVLNRIESSFER